MVKFPWYKKFDNWIQIQLIVLYNLKRNYKWPSMDDNAWYSKALSGQVWIIYDCFCFLKLGIFICSFSAIVTCVFLVYKKQWRNSHKKKQVLTQQNYGIRLRFHGYNDKSGIVSFLWRVTWNYAYFLFKL